MGCDSVDYYPCDRCGKDLIWDSGWMLKAVEVTGVGDIKALCEDCAREYELLIAKKES